MGCYSRSTVQHIFWEVSRDRTMVHEMNLCVSVLGNTRQDHRAVWQSQHRTEGGLQTCSWNGEAFEVLPDTSNQAEYQQNRKSTWFTAIKRTGKSRKHLSRPRTVLVTLEITSYITCPGASKDCSGRNRLWRLGNFLSLQTQLSFYSCFQLSFCSFFHSFCWILALGKALIPCAKCIRQSSQITAPIQLVNGLFYAAVSHIGTSFVHKLCKLLVWGFL